MGWAVIHALSLLRDNTVFAPLSLCSFPPSQTKLSPIMTSSLYKLTVIQVLELLKNNTITLSDRIKENDGTVKAWARLSKLLPSLLSDQC